jgi:hypothetical protein
MEPKHVTLNGSEYSIGRLNLFQALDVCRLVSPMLPALFGGVLDGLVKISETAKEGEEQDTAAQIALALTVSQPLFAKIAEMPKDDFQTVISTCLSCVEKKRGKGWGKVIADGVPMDDVSVFDAIALSVHVIVRELRPFMNALNPSKEA